MNNAIILELLVSIMLASTGGVVRRLVESEKNTYVKRTFSYYLIGAVISMFVGGVIWLLCKGFGVPQFLTASLASIGGYGGSPILDRIEKISMSKAEQAIGYTEPKEKEEKKDE